MRQANKEQESRKFFRIDDQIILHYSIVSDKDKTEDEVQSLQQSIDRFTLKARFDVLTLEIQPLHHKVIDSCSPDVALYLSAIDKKLNTLSEYFVMAEMSDMDMTLQDVNIGAGGMAFSSSNPIMVGTKIELRFILLPKLTGIFSYAKVVSCSNTNVNKDGKSYLIAVEYEDMISDDRDLIISHVITRERAAISN